MIALTPNAVVFVQEVLMMLGITLFALTAVGLVSYLMDIFRKSL